MFTVQSRKQSEQNKTNKTKQNNNMIELQKWNPLCHTLIQ